MDSSAAATKRSTRWSAWALRKTPNRMLTLSYPLTSNPECAAKRLKGLSCSVNSPR
jgi:hypothetical protein